MFQPPSILANLLHDMMRTEPPGDLLSHPPLSKGLRDGRPQARINISKTQYKATLNRSLENLNNHPRLDSLRIYHSFWANGL